MATQQHYPQQAYMQQHQQQYYHPQQQQQQQQPPPPSYTYASTAQSALAPAHTTPPFTQASSRSLVQPHPQQQQQQQQQQQPPPQQQYNHYNQYQQGPASVQQHQRQQYQHHQHTIQQQQQQMNGGQTPSTLPALNSLKDWFDAVDTDHSGSLSCEELQRALMNGDGWTPFNVETVRMMMNMFDRDGDGSISFNEFIGLWNYIEKWKNCFRTYDLDGSGTIDGNELQKALRGFGYNLSEAIVSLIVTKYDVRGQGDISFDNFVQSCVTVQTLTDAFRRIDQAGTGVVTMTYEQFLGLVINNR
ncbi:Alpha-1 3/1 6-mannosyltransferase alg-2 [Mortierella alpina]|nr:Alpha-1 3/1 6-mannosyltransferase alg-2 [Mortierella alpina]